MFGFLKKKLKDTLGKFSKKVEEEAEVVEEAPEVVPEQPAPQAEEPKQAEPEAQPKEAVIEPKQPEKKKQPEPETKQAPPAEEKKPEPAHPPAPEQEPKKEEIEPETVPQEQPTPVQPTEEPEAEAQPKEKEKGFLGIFKKKEKEQEQPKEQKGFFSKVTESVTKVQLSEQKFEDLFWDLEVTLLENNVAVEVVEKIKADLKGALTADRISRKGLERTISDALKHSIQDLFKVEGFDLVQKARTKKPFVIAMIGVNGSGKTTTMAKLAHLFQKNGLTVVMAAADTFRAAAIQQLEEHADRLKTKLIKQDYQSDPAAVAFDAIEHAKAKAIDVVLIDTAGRLHSNQNLMDELKKLIRVNKPDLKLFIGESTTGNDCVEQAKYFDAAVGIDAIILAKADVDEKGGAAISVSFVTKKPILFLGTGQTYDDLKPFDAELLVEQIGLS